MSPPTAKKAKAAQAPPARPAKGTLTGRNLALLLGLGALWGTAFMFISLGLAEGKAFREVPILFAALRFDIAGAVVLAIALFRKSNLVPRGARQWTAIAIASLLNVAAYHAFLFMGQRFTTAAIAAVIVGLNPVITTVFSRALLSDERVGWGGALGLLLGVGGIVTLATLKPGNLLDPQGLGELMVLVAVASWSMGSILIRRTQHGMDVFAFTTWQMLGGGAVLHALSFLLEDMGAARWDGEGIVSLLYLAIVSSALGFLIYFTLLERIGPIRANLVSHVAPVFAAVAGLLVLGEPFELRSVFAFVLIASGFALVARPSSAPPAASPGARGP